MRKTFYSLVCAAACLLTLTSCDPTFLDELLGNATLTISDPTSSTYYADSTEISFSSSLTDRLTAEDSASWSNLALSANIDLTMSSSIAPPYLGIATTDTLCHSYAVTSPFYFSNLASFNADQLLSSTSSDNLFVLAASDTCWYIGYAGTITIDSFPAYGSLMQGTVSQVQARYITQSKLDYVTDLMDRAEQMDAEAITALAALDTNTYFQTVTFNGSFASRRYTINALVQSLQKSAARK